MHDIQSFDCLASDLSSQVIDHLAKNLSDEVLC